MNIFPELAFILYSWKDWLPLIVSLITISTAHGGLYVVIGRVFDMYERLMVEYLIAQSGTCRVPHFVQGSLKKRLDQSNRWERHAAISCHAFCSTACLHPLFCSYSCQHYQLNPSQCSTSFAGCAQSNCPHTLRHSPISSTCLLLHIQTHTITDHFLALWPDQHWPTKPSLSGIQQQKAAAASSPFLPAF